MLRLTTALVFLLVVPAAAQEAATGTRAFIDQLSSFDYQTRMSAARQLRRLSRAEAFPALSAAVADHPDQFVRARALVLLSGFGPTGVAEVMERAMTDRNDRMREVAYRWFELHPDPRLTSTLLNALTTEEAEFVRPALVRALAAVGSDPLVQRALVAEAGRGLDFFRSAVIEALGAHKAAYATEAIAAVAKLEGPLQDDAVLALGRIGGPAARGTLATFTSPPPALIPALQAALCFVEDACAVRLEVLRDTARSRAATPELVRSSIRALGDVASTGNPAALTILVDLGTAADATPRTVGDVALAVSTAALRNPAFVFSWLGDANEATRDQVMTLLKEGFDSLEEDFAEEQFYVTVRDAYWAAAENSPTRALAAALIERLEF